MQGLWFVKPWLARILLRLTLFCTASLVILLCLWIKMLLPTVHLSSELDQKIFSIPCYMTIQLCLRKDIAAFAFDVGFIWWGMSYMVIGEVTLGVLSIKWDHIMYHWKQIWLNIRVSLSRKGHLSGASQERRFPQIFGHPSFKWHGKYDYNYSTFYEVPYGDWWTLLI